MSFQSNNNQGDGSIVKFSPFASSVESSFWVRYCREKLETIRLNEDPVEIVASYGITDYSKSKAAAAMAAQPPRLECRETSLLLPDHQGDEGLVPSDRIRVKGFLRGFNTTETFQSTDKNLFLKETFVPKFLEGDHDCLVSMVLLTYADLKHHKVLYWFAVPALLTKPGCSIRTVQPHSFVRDTWSESQRQKFHNCYLEWRTSDSVNPASSCPPYFFYANGTCHTFGKDSFEQLSKNDLQEEVVFCFVDPCTFASAGENQKQLPVMGWPMRNLVAYLCFHLGLGGRMVSILSFRPKGLLNRATAEGTIGNSMLLKVWVPQREDYYHGSMEGDDPARLLKAVGWEANARGKAGPRWVNLGPLLDAHHLAVQAADLNLKLMKWRMIPKLDVEMLQSTKVLLLGAGTLGCNVARVLLGWGIRDITIVDYGKVSYSNPVRQSLFTLQDCQDGGRPKAAAAADALHSIAADVKSEGIRLSIPMPGHAENDREALQATMEKLDHLVQRSDVVYLLTDTRESRWLPTVMAAAHDKMLINAALGLDSWLVMRHGGGLGCYFCNDVVAPENSMRNRTLDQQCTVTRPGLAPVASSMAVELMVSLLHHPLRHRAPAPSSSSQGQAFSPTVSDKTESASPLGVMPHQIRGSLVSYTMMAPSVPAFTCCTGCSPLVVEAYRKDKVELMQRVCQSADGSYLEGLSGLTAFRALAAVKMEDMVEDAWDFDMEE